MSDQPSTRALNLALMAQRDDVTAHEVALEIDRFAAQRGAEAVSYDDRDAGNRMVDAFLKEHESPQTGGGDAGERAREEDDRPRG